MKIILGIDPSMANCGYCALGIESGQLIPIKYGTANLNTIKGETEFLSVLQYCKDRNFDGNFLGIFYENATFNIAHGRSEQLGQAIRRGQCSAIGTILGMAKCYGLKPYGKLKKDCGVSPGTIKKAVTGSGRADKEAVIKFIFSRYGITADEHTADAIGVAMVGANRIFQPILPKMGRGSK